MVKRYEPCHKWYAYDNEPTLEMQESAYGEYVKLETFQHEMARLQAQVDRMRKEGQRLHEAELTLKSEKSKLERRFKWLCEQSWFQDTAEHYLNLKDTEYIDKFTNGVIEAMDSHIT